MSVSLSDLRCVSNSVFPAFLILNRHREFLNYSVQKGVLNFNIAEQLISFATKSFSECIDIVADEVSIRRVKWIFEFFLNLALLINISLKPINLTLNPSFHHVRVLKVLVYRFNQFLLICWLLLIYDFSLVGTIINFLF